METTVLQCFGLGLFTAACQGMDLHHGASCASIASADDVKQCNGSMRKDGFSLIMKMLKVQGLLSRAAGVALEESDD